VKRLDIEMLLRLRTDDEFFFEYVVNLAVLLIKDSKEFDSSVLKEVSTTVEYVLEFLNKACVLSSYLLNDTDSLEENELYEYSKANFERVKNFVESKDPTYTYLINAFHRNIIKFLE
jgi:hypothetical protein